MKQFILPYNIGIQKIISFLSNDFNFKITHTKGEKIFFDTFDWRLFQTSLILYYENNHFFLAEMLKSNIISSQRYSQKNKIFWWQFTDKTLTNSLKPVSGVRALQEVIHISCTKHTIRVLDSLEKTTVLAELDIIRTINTESFFKVLTVRDIRGYKNEYQIFLKALSNLPLLNVNKSVYPQIFAASGRIPGKYSSKLDITLHPDMSGTRASKIILLHLLKTCQQNVQGIIKDIDTEFLHDFRVAIRRARSYLGQVKIVFPANETEEFLNSFRQIAKATNLCRDLDVYLLKKNDYKKMLPARLHNGLEPLFEVLAHQRTIEAKNIAKMIASKDMVIFFKRWNNYLNSASDFTEEKIIDIAKTTIKKKYIRVVKIGKKITSFSPDKELHRLRIECKKLRYLLEFFASLFPTDEMKKLTGQLKVLQDNLGEFNDLSIQQNKLSQFLQEFDPNDENLLAITSTIGGLIAVMNLEQKEKRAAFFSIFENFIHPENIELYQKLFYPNTREEPVSDNSSVL